MHMTLLLIALCSDTLICVLRLCVQTFPGKWLLSDAYLHKRNGLC